MVFLKLIGPGVRSTSLCSECATQQFALRATCPVCRKDQTLEQLLRLYPEYSVAPLEAYSGPCQTAPPSPSSDSDSPPPSLRTLRTPSLHSLRLWIDVTGTRFPRTLAAVVPVVDADGTPVFLGLAAFKEGLHPCKICVEPQGLPVPRVSHGVGEVRARGHDAAPAIRPAGDGVGRRGGRGDPGPSRAGTSVRGRRRCSMCGLWLMG
ncbi:hypothetical protein GSI_04400 [Ganoderma sinense ZZ0214-1]|uniref:Uncharacterized protein n=1 Tax=Ganoderma sinense ZZ0214-1 TaxID=1077348 RepID=A0A2G8SJ14_9APHY|nr:hypothetical protein GSI_04400 [Ganoderma sinense ZZ0214-1]